MSRRTRFLICWIATAVIFVAMEAPAKPRDEVWINPNLPRHTLFEVAVLPVVTINGDDRAARIVEDEWMHVFIVTPHSWTSPDESRKRLSTTARQDSLLRGMRRQVIRQGRIDRDLARTLSRSLAAPALLTLRIDQWQRSAESASGYTVASVRIIGALVDSSGTLLWRGSGGEHHRVRSDSSTPMKAMAWGVEPDLEAHARRGEGEPDFAHADFDSATVRLFTRWMAQFPKPRLVGQ